MEWSSCISRNRFGKQEVGASIRTDFQRDYDRIIFASSFRRLQNKTQVFPLPGNTFVHNRLTHSLEVASVGRSLGAIIGERIATKYSAALPDHDQEFYRFQLSSLIAAACLAHDLGNPPFGHSGEKAISNYFEEAATTVINGQALRSFFTDAQWLDLTNFEGNANALHLLTKKYSGKMIGGMSLTYTTLAAILKYPCGADAIYRGSKHRKKYGYFQHDKPLFEKIAAETAMIPDPNMPTFGCFRHPFVYLVEAADDICYRIIDMEDAHRIGLLGTDLIEEIFISIINDIHHPNDNLDKIRHTCSEIVDSNEKIAYVRAKVINTMVNACADIFTENQEQILQGKWNNTLVDVLEKDSVALQRANLISIDKIYNHPSVIEVELAGYNVLSALLGTFVPIILNEKNSSIQQKTLLLIPEQYKQNDEASPYEKIINIVDFIAGMTDGYATELYRKIKGIEIARHA